MIDAREGRMRDAIPLAEIVLRLEDGREYTIPAAMLIEAAVSQSFSANQVQRWGESFGTNVHHAIKPQAEVTLRFIAPGDFVEGYAEDGAPRLPQGARRRLELLDKNE